MLVDFFLYFFPPEMEQFCNNLFFCKSFPGDINAILKKICIDISPKFCIISQNFVMARPLREELYF